MARRPGRSTSHRGDPSAAASFKPCAPGQPERIRKTRHHRGRAATCSPQSWLGMTEPRCGSRSRGERPPHPANPRLHRFGTSVLGDIREKYRLCSVDQLLRARQRTKHLDGRFVHCNAGGQSSLCSPGERIVSMPASRRSCIAVGMSRTTMVGVAARCPQYESPWWTSAAASAPQSTTAIYEPAPTSCGRPAAQPVLLYDIPARSTGGGDLRLGQHADEDVLAKARERRRNLQYGEKTARTIVEAIAKDKTSSEEHAAGSDGTLHGRILQLEPQGIRFECCPSRVPLRGPASAISSTLTGC